ncbi:MAG TPA: nucleoside-diphosphate kinase [Candidatus Krumholzibacteriaceae bacterium]|nr:nucleoside-diphosphate kinase [Candidatus Krumholzibacteriaceae bacterium]
MTKTFLMIKPEAVKNGNQGAIIDLLIMNRFEITKLKQFKFKREKAESFYAVHKDKPFFNELISYITSGSVIGIELEKEDSIELLRKLVGATDPKEANPGTIRYMYGTDLQENAVHASDSPESAEKELAIVFDED